MPVDLEVDPGKKTMSTRRRESNAGQLLRSACIMACTVVLVLDFLPRAEAGAGAGRRTAARDGRSKYVDRETFEDSMHHLRQVQELL